MATEFQALNSYKAFVQHLNRNRIVKCYKLATQVFTTYFDDMTYQVDESKTMTLTAREYFGGKPGFKLWVKELISKGILQKVGSHKSSEYKIAFKAKEYLINALSEVRVFPTKTALVADNKRLVKENAMLLEKMEKLEAMVAELLARGKRPEEPEVKERHLRLVKDD